MIDDGARRVAAAALGAAAARRTRRSCGSPTASSASRWACWATAATSGFARAARRADAADVERRAAYGARTLLARSDADASCAATAPLRRPLPPHADPHASPRAPLPLPARARVPRTRRRLARDRHAAAVPLGVQGPRASSRSSRLVAAKVANVGVPVLLKSIVDSLDARTAALAVPLALLVAYGLLRLSTTLFTELREFLFAKVTQRAVRTIALEVFRHLHALSLRFHLARQTGGLTRDVERGQRGISTLISFTLFSILPTLVEIGAGGGDPRSPATTGRSSRSPLAALVALRRRHDPRSPSGARSFRRQMNELDSKANTRAIDSLLNYETVKYFGNEDCEARRYDESMQRWEKAAVKSQTSLSLLNVGAERDHRRSR